MIWHFAGVIAAAAAAHKAAEEARSAAERMKRAYGELSSSNSACAYCQSEHSKEYCPNCGAPSARKTDLVSALHRINPHWGTKTSVPDHVANPYLPAITGVYDSNLGKPSEDDSRKRRDEEDQRKKRRDEEDERVRNSTPVWSPAPDYSSSIPDTSSSDTGSSYSGGGGSFDGGGSSGDW